MANNENLVPIKKGQVLNPNGRPRKTIGSTLKALEAKGVVTPSREELLEVYLKLMTLHVDEIKKLSASKTETILVKTVATKLKDGKGFDIIEKMLDRAIGKAVQNLDVTTKGKELNYTPEERELRIIQLLEKRNAKGK